MESQDRRDALPLSICFQTPAAQNRPAERHLLAKEQTEQFRRAHMRTRSGPGPASVKPESDESDDILFVARPILTPAQGRTRHSRDGDVMLPEGRSLVSEDSDSERSRWLSRRSSSLPVSREDQEEVQVQVQAKDKGKRRAVVLAPKRTTTTRTNSTSMTTMLRARAALRLVLASALAADR